jgi:hypothetical protein
MLFFKNSVKVPHYLEERIKEILADKETFTLEGFFDEYQEMILVSGSGETAKQNGEQAVTLPDRNLFLNRFIGTLLWLIKYRTLSTAKNNPRKLAFLDLRFDIETPKIVDKLFKQYNRDTIKESYDAIDIGCKKAFTGELQKVKRPRFLISPLWTENPDPHPFRIAARIFINDLDHETSRKLREIGSDSRLEILMEERFRELTQSTADSCREINFVWIFNR